MNALTSMLNQARPFISAVALLFGALAAWKGLSEIVPVLGQVFSPRGDAQRLALIAGALALVANGARS